MDAKELSELKDKARAKGYSILVCSVCSEPLMAKDYRTKNPLCPSCSRVSNAVDWARKRYTNFQQGTLSEATKEKILKTRSGGPYFKAKQ